METPRIPVTHTEPQATHILVSRQDRGRDKGRERGRGTYINVRLAEATRKARSTCARVRVHRISAHAAVATGIGSAFVDLSLTVRARPTGQTGAEEAVDTVTARAAVDAGIGGAFLHRSTAHGSPTRTIVNGIDIAGGVRERGRKPYVDIGLAEAAGVARRTKTSDRVDAVRTRRCADR